MKSRIRYSLIAVLTLSAGMTYAMPRILENWPFHAPEITSESAVYSPTMGDILFNTTNSQFLGYDGSSWINFGGTGTPNYSVLTKTTNYTITTSDDILLADATSSAFTLSLPTAVGHSGKVFTIKKIDSSNGNAITVDGNSTETIDSSVTTTVNTQNETVSFVSDGSNWQILSRRYPSGWVSAGTITIQATTTNPTKGSTQSVDTVYWRRVGDSAEIRMDFRQTSASGSAAGSGDYLFKIPAGIGIIDTAKVNVYATVEGWNSTYTNAFSVGTATVNDGTNDGIGVVVPYDSTSVRIFANTAASQGGTIGSAGFPATSANVQYNLTFTVPISGWKD